MFNFLNLFKKESKKKEDKSAYFYVLCKNELYEYTSNLYERDTRPSIEECICAAVNAKIIYLLFKNVPEIGIEARVNAVKILGQTMSLMAEEYKITELSAGTTLTEIIDEEIDLLMNRKESERVFGCVAAASIMSSLVGFGESIF